MLSDVMEDYLKAIYVLQREDGAPVRTSAIAEYLDVTPPTVTSMLEKLTERGLVTREKYKGAELTPEGETVALEVIRHHRLIEAFLADALDYELDAVHEEADTLEHHISEEFEAAISAQLGEPARDPHGDPIPGTDLEPPGEEDTVPLSALSAGDRVVVARVSDQNEEELRYLAERSVEPGTTLTVVEVAPIGLVVVEHADGTVRLPEDVATSIRVRPADDAGGDADEAST